ncbi:precorrin-2 C(20)-methyltransferase [Planosporangium mesophilum]|uniref:Precorrin-2 C(20)-methyltransferase n=1 Tax=Planosporangium mesophilum TaxID=689768 RepID=A0A8J3WZQ0_9ACTN|nr:precorrin-2 C(20)-methyltransferase [Planosporangium mesophilum]NJC86069.1 precorrin-2 C(20)-methyltransferase [Planosporangium mesophilum]GII21499.1 precorrin-2 C(20)-methyltransferase [Planosporangium mesophilum]
MRLIGVGVGPGDPELVTLKAVRVLATAGRVFVPVLDAADTGRAEATVRAHASHERIERLVFALNERTDTARRERHWDAAGSRVAQWLRDTGGTAAFATIGDPNVYSTFGYLAQTVRDLLPDVVVETIPGITAMQAMAAASGTPLVEGTEPLTLLPLARGVEPLRDALTGDGTVVVYKGGRHLRRIAELAKDAGRDAVYGEHLGLPDERVRSLSDVDDSGPYLATVLLPARRSSRGGKL